MINKNIKTKSFKNSETIQKKESGPDHHKIVSKNNVYTFTE